MQVLLLNPPFLAEHGKFSRSQRSPAITKSGTLYYPMWLAYAAGLLEQHGFKVTLWDCPADRIPFSQVEDFIRREQPDLVVLDTSTPSIVSDLEARDRIKLLRPSTFVVLVGTHVSALPEESLRHSRSVDGVALREYEHTLLDLATALRDRTSPAKVPGLCLRGGGEPVRTPDRELPTDLDALPFVSAVYQRQVFLAAGGFDQEFPIACAEDVELSYRLANLGGKMVFNPKALVIHQHPKTIGQYLRKKFKFAYWRVLCLKKNPSKILADSHTPQSMKVQLLMFPALVSSLLLALVSPWLAWISFALFILTLFTTVPFAAKAFHKDAAIGLLAPVFLILRSGAQFLGVSLGILNNLRTRAAI